MRSARASASSATKSAEQIAQLVVRLEGTNVERGRQILEQSGLALTAAKSLDEAAKLAVAAARGAKS
jgi:succinyl-CoA synthetase beta subunit